jgi:hypothetical protein
MIKFYISLIFTFPLISYAGIWADAKQAAEKAADAEILLDAVNELSETVADESDLNKQLGSARQKSTELRSSLRELNLTKEEIDDVLQGDQMALDDIANTITRTSRRIKKAKDLKSKFAKYAAGTPAAVNAVQTMEMNQTLREIHTELTHQRIDRQIEKENKRGLVVEEMIEEKRKEAFFKRQFSLMDRSSRINNVSFFPFENSDKGRTKDVSFFRW